jgi:hypothetical protein
MRNDDTNDLYRPFRREILEAIGINGLALLGLLVAGYFTPDLLALLVSHPFPR